jgi:hypothetical protein
MGKKYKRKETSYFSFQTARRFAFFVVCYISEKNGKEREIERKNMLRCECVCCVND